MDNSTQLEQLEKDIVKASKDIRQVIVNLSALYPNVEFDIDTIKYSFGVTTYAVTAQTKPITLYD